MVSGGQASKNLPNSSGLHLSLRRLLPIALHRSITVAGDWKRRATQGTKRKLEFDGCGDACSSKRQEEDPSKKKR